MGEKRGFGKSGRNEGYNSAARGSRTTDTRGTDSGAARGMNNGAARGRSFGDAHGSNYGTVHSGINDSAANSRGGRSKDVQGESRSSDFRGSGNRPQDTGGFNRNRPQDGSGFNRNRPQDGSSFNRNRPQDGCSFNRNRPQDGSGFNRSKSQDAGGFNRNRPQDGSSFNRNRSEKPYSHIDTQSKREELQDNRNFTGEDNNSGLQEDLDKLEGRNSVIEALKAGRSINRIFVAKGDREGSVNQIIAMARQNHILIQEIDRAKLDAMSLTNSHQGVIALTAAKDYVEVDDILESAAASGRPPFIIILDEITDSYNLGSILRTANAAGVHGVIIPKRRAVGLTSAVSKASAGAIEYVPVARVTNIVQTIENLKKQNIWVVGTDSTGEEPYFEKDLTGPIALVIGSEGEGMGKLVRESCDFVVNIPMLGQISSLNAAVAGAIVTYEILRQRSKKQP